MRIYIDEIKDLPAMSIGLDEKGYYIDTDLETVVNLLSRNDVLFEMLYYDMQAKIPRLGLPDGYYT